MTIKNPTKITNIYYVGDRICVISPKIIYRDYGLKSHTIYDSQSFKIICTVEDDNRGIMFTHFSSDNKYMILESFSKFTIFDMATGIMVEEIDIVTYEIINYEGLISYKKPNLRIDDEAIVPHVQKYIKEYGIYQNLIYETLFRPARPGDDGESRRPARDQGSLPGDRPLHPAQRHHRPRPLLRRASHLVRGRRATCCASRCRWRSWIRPSPRCADEFFGLPWWPRSWR